MKRELPVRFREGLGAQLPRATRLLLGFIGSKQEAVEIRDRLGHFLGHNLKLELSMAKTLITHGSEKARFLGYEMTVTRANNRLDKNGQRQLNGQIALLMPAEVVTKVRQSYSCQGKVTHQANLIYDTDYSIVSRYQSVLRGIYNYYSLAINVSKRMSRINWILQTSLLKTMARKYQTSIRFEFRRLRAWSSAGRRILLVTVERQGKEPLIAQYGGIAFERQTKPQLPGVDVTYDSLWRRSTTRRSELVIRLLIGRCEICGSEEDIQVHHIRKLADLNRPGQRPADGWKQLMASRKRKSLVVCEKCHKAIHAGKYDGIPLAGFSPESRVQ